MVGTRQLTRVTARLQQLGCKLVLIGAPNQLQPIEAGTPFKDITAKHKAAKLTEIRRQQEDWQREASRDLATGNIEMALRNYSDHGAVHETRSRDHAIAKLVADYVQDMNDHDDIKSRLALAHRRKDVHAINQGIRTTLQAEGKLKNEKLFNTEHGPRAFSKGDRLLFTRNDTNLNVRNGLLATVEKVGDNKLTLRLDNEDGEKSIQITFAPSQFSSFDHGYAVTIHRSQGTTVGRSFVLSSNTLDDNLAYVALTRHKQKSVFYTASEIAMKNKRSAELNTIRNHKTGESSPSRNR